MSGLILKLAPRERLLVNGAVIENGEKRARISIQTKDANILRLRDAIHPEEANTPVKRVCYVAQLVLSGDLPEEAARLKIYRRIEELTHALQYPESLKLLHAATEAASLGDYYRCLKALRGLLPLEQRLLAGQIQ